MIHMHDSINELRVKHIKSHSSRTLTIEQQCNPENSLRIKNIQRIFGVKTTLKNHNSKESSDSTES